ncbi:hypothetical protein GCM10023196_049400 [Actinoallomurus vinaceus]|uniref:Uncharacterized protein n=1 Tax=Actinoallomurus vinaceus TaxID=1080074 RepID=A0ABP8UFH1_9ACTN
MSRNLADVNASPGEAGASTRPKASRLALLPRVTRPSLPSVGDLDDEGDVFGFVCPGLRLGDVTWHDDDVRHLLPVRPDGREDLDRRDDLKAGSPRGLAERRCACRKSHPHRSGGVLVLVEDAAEAVASVYVEVGGGVRLADR